MHGWQAGRERGSEGNILKRNKYHAINV